MTKFTDHYTRFKAGYFIETKDETLRTLCRFIKDLAIPLGLRVHRLRSDRGGEHIADYFGRYCKTTDILQEFTAPYTPQQDGISEPYGKTILKITSCLLNEANLPKIISGKIAANARVLINCLPHTSNDRDTPYHRTFLEQPKLSFLRTIGLRAFVHKYQYQSKLEEEAWEGV
ncbi:unnamed protein product [Sphacelaria rigidula]